MLFRVLALIVASVQAPTAAPLLDSLKPKAELFYQSVAWSADGQWLAFTECAGCSKYSPDKWTLGVVRVDGSQRRNVVTGASFATWSPDGRFLITGLKRDGNDDIYRIRPDGTELTRLTDDPAYDGQPAWSPKGDLIAFASKRGAGGGGTSYNIYVINADGSSPRRLTSDSAGDYNPAWSPDGSHIVFFRERGDNKDQVWIVDVATGREERVTDGTNHNTYPSYLPDGRIAFHQSRPDGAGALVAGRVGRSEWTAVTSVPAFFGRWSPKGSLIVVTGGGSWPRSAVYLLGADGSVRGKLFN